MKHNYPQLKILNRKQKTEIETQLENQFGIKEITGIIIKRGTERLFLYQGNLTEQQIKELEKDLHIERIGIYFAKIVEKENTIRLSIEGTHILKNQITKNIFKLTKEQLEQWMKGSELNIKTGKKGFFVIKYENDFLGCGKISTEKIGNFIPKNRRLKEKNN